MENRIKNYENFIKKELKKNPTTTERTKLIELHENTIQNFQHERLIHLIITLFFVFVTIIFLLITACISFAFGSTPYLIPLYILVALLSILSFFYVKHYYFLENHIQTLYDLSHDLFIFKS